MITSYKTIIKATEGLYKEKGSKFIAFATPVNTVAKVELQLDQLRKKYHDARHHCYAYILGAEGKELRANDDGEPKHSAGDPILGQIKSAGITNTLVTVVRYFGGTKLGVSGLINAYKTAAFEALSKNVVTTNHIKQRATFSFPYASTNEIMKLVSNFQIQVEHQKYEANCTLSGLVKVADATRLEEQVALLQQTGTPMKFSLSTIFI